MTPQLEQLINDKTENLYPYSIPYSQDERMDADYMREAFVKGANFLFGLIDKKEALTKDQIVETIRLFEHTEHRNVGTGCNYETYILPSEYYSLAERLQKLIPIDKNSSYKEDKQSILFSEWIGNQHGLEYKGGGEWYSDFDDATFTTESLYKKFISEQKAKQSLQSK